MKVKILASGSKGNCIVLQYGEKCILIDAGVAKTKIEKALLEHGIYPNAVQAIFITHAHGDHIKGLPFANKYHIPVFATSGEWRSISKVDVELQRSIETVFGAYSAIEIQGASICPFPTHHDAYEPVGFSITDGQTKVSVCLDTGKVDKEMLEAMRDSDIYIIEANHDSDMVEVGQYPSKVKERILSDNGHLSNEQTAKVLQRLVQGNGEKIYLVHLSSKNNLPSLAELTVKQFLKQKGLIIGQQYNVEVVS
nr:MBL fold metallo-hydrolase [Brevibacillus laterosporus]